MKTHTYRVADITHTLCDKVLEICLGERFTSANDREFSRIVGMIPLHSVERVAIDLSHTQFIDSSGISMLLIARETCEEANAKLALRKPPPQLMSTFEIIRFNDLFVIEME
ncbi:MAG: STAS domain-containing protein [Alphaproteobacteria bacterium]|nr:STAS domain-containing protein [Alphaproteobacteria bacterium]